MRALGGVPLIAWTIAAAARAAGATVPFKRPAALASDDASTLDVVKHAVLEYEKSKGPVGVVVLLQVTTPMRTAEHIDATVHLVSEGGADSAQTVALDEAHPLHKFTLNDGRLKRGLIGDAK